MLTELLNDPALAASTKLKAIELGMRNLGLLVDRQVQEVTQRTSIDETLVQAQAAIDRLIAVPNADTQETVSNNKYICKPTLEHDDIEAEKAGVLEEVQAQVGCKEDSKGT